jgi:hypothetical protein
VLRFIINLWLTAWLSFLAAAAVQSQRPVDLSHLQGLKAPAGKVTTPPLQDLLEQAIWHRAELFTISEADTNLYLAAVIKGRLTGVGRYFANFKRVSVDFEPELCRIWFEWEVLGRRSAASMDVTVNREGPNFIVEIKGGSYGLLPIRRGALAAMVPCGRSLCEALEDEIHAIFQMNHVHFEKDKVVLDPRFETAK